MAETQYYKKIKNKKIAIFGVTPPPLGGVSIHIQRVAREFKKNNNEVYHFQTDFRGRRYLLPLYLIYAALYLLWNKIDIIYYHALSQPNSTTEIRFLAFIKKLLKFQIILIEHNCRHMYARKNISKLKFSKSMKNIDEIIFLWNSTYNSYVENNITLPKTYTIDSAFLPPDITKKNKILKTYPHSLQTFINNSTPVLLVNASRLAMFQNKDLYGLDKSIHATARLKHKHKNIGLIIALASMDNKEYFKTLHKKIEDLHIQENVFFLLDQRELWPLMQKIDVFLRPTLRDATGISIFEAFLFNKAVVASNVCERPKKTIVFDIENEHDFVSKIDQTITSTRKGFHETY